ncbi:MAG: S-adenosylmethionine:tRNA ribosyltransferase-isomerase, partial [Candidatus Cybelea sp.]
MTFQGRPLPISSDERLAAAYDYELPKELIAQQPALRRDESRLLVVDQNGTDDHLFRDLPKFLRSDDLLVLNETRVIAARLFGERTRGPASVELLLLHPAGSLRYDCEALTWVALARPARRLREGDHVSFGEFGEATVTGVLPDGMREIEFSLT